ncbi:MAG: G5 domain-containing protein [Acutalibacteraceae bacterium]
MIAQIKGAGDKLYYNIARVAILVLTIIICTATTVAAANSVVVSYVFCDNEMTKVVSFSSDVDDILNKANIELNENDIVDLTSYTEDEDESVIYVYRSCEVTVKDGDKKIFVKTAGTVKDAVEKAGIELNEGDELSYDGDLYVFDSMVIEVKRSFGVKVIADSKVIKCRVTDGTTVAETLENAGITLGEYDTVSKSLTKTVEKDDELVVKRVSYETHKETEVLSFKTVTKKDSSMYMDQSKVIQQGKNGKQVVTYKDKYVDGKLTKSEIINTNVKVEAQDKIVAVGTKSRPVTKISGRYTISELTPPKSLELDENGRPTNYKKVLTGKATAYYSGTTCSTGVHVKPGYVAVNPKQIPYGTKMYIVSSDGKWNYGYAIAADTGGFAWNGSNTMIDLFMWSEADCRQFGRRSVDVYILE